MQRRARQYDIRLAHPDGSESVVQTFAQTIGQAVGMAEAQQTPGTHAVSATSFIEFVGRCCKCHHMIEAHEIYKTVRGKCVCSDCAPVGLK